MAQPGVAEGVPVKVDWLQKELELDPTVIRERKYEGSLHDWVWELWSRLVLHLVHPLMMRVGEER
jgi:hypothetical protein